MIVLERWRNKPRIKIKKRNRDDSMTLTFKSMELQADFIKNFTLFMKFLSANKSRWIYYLNRKQMGSKWKGKGRDPGDQANQVGGAINQKTFSISWDVVDQTHGRNNKMVLQLNVFYEIIEEFDQKVGFR